MTGNVGFTADDSCGDLASDVLNNTMIGDPDPCYEDRISYDYVSISMTGKNIGDLLNAKGISCGWFQGEFTSSSPFVPAKSRKRRDTGAHYDERARWDARDRICGLAQSVPVAREHKQPTSRCVGERGGSETQRIC